MICFGTAYSPSQQDRAAALFHDTHREKSDSADILAVTLQAPSRRTPHRTNGRIVQPCCISHETIDVDIRASQSPMSFLSELSSRI